MLYTLLSYLVPSAIFLYFVCGYEGRNLKKKLKSLGNLSEMKKGQIIAKAGEPDSVSILENGVQLVQWHRYGYRIAMKFDYENNFKEIIQES
jgi:hypothetical protein